MPGRFSNTDDSRVDKLTLVVIFPQKNLDKEQIKRNRSVTPEYAQEPLNTAAFRHHCTVLFVEMFSWQR